MQRVLSRIRWVIEAKSSASAISQTLVARFLLIGVNLLTGIILSRFLGVEGRGIHAAIALWPGLLGFSLSLGIPSSIIYNFNKYPERKNDLLLSAISLSLCLGVTSALVGFFLLPLSLRNYSADVLNQARIMLWVTPVVLLSAIANTTSEAEGDFLQSNQLRLYPAFLTLFVLVGLITFDRVQPINTVLAYQLPSLMVTGWILWKLFKHFRLKLSINFKAAPILLSYGIRSYGYDLLVTWSSQAGVFFGVNALAPRDVGLYSVAFSASRLLLMFQTSAVDVLRTKIAATSSEVSLEKTARIARFTLFLTVFLGLILALLASVLLRFVYGDDFMGAVMIMRLLTLDAVISGLVLILGQPFAAVGKPELNALCQGGGLLLTIPLASFFASRFGLDGLGCALVVASSFRLMLVFACYKVVLNRGVPRLYLLPSDWSALRSAIDW